MSNPTIEMKIRDQGTIVLELEPQMAPNTVNNFLSLVQKGFYNGLTFHRVISGFMIQGGDPEGSGMGGPGYSIKGEFANNGFTANKISHRKGVISMARSYLKDSAGSQFFIMHEDGTFLDREYAAFGHVIQGQDVVDAVATIPTWPNDMPRVPQVIDSVKVLDMGDWTFAEPEKV